MIGAGARPLKSPAVPCTAVMILGACLEQGSRDPGFETFSIGDRGSPSGTLASGIASSGMFQHSQALSQYGFLAAPTFSSRIQAFSAPPSPFIAVRLLSCFGLRLLGPWVREVRETMVLHAHTGKPSSGSSRSISRAAFTHAPSSSSSSSGSSSASSSSLSSSLPMPSDLRSSCSLRQVG